MRSRLARNGLAAALIASALVPLSWSRAAHAFADATQFFANPKAPHAATLGASGEGLYFTGAPRFASRTCADCHNNGPLALGLKLGVDDQSLFSTGYVPGKTYHLQVELTNESQGLQYGGATCTDPPGSMDTFTFKQCNYNGFALEIDTATGPLLGNGVFCASAPSGGMCPPPSDADEALVAPDGDAVMHNLPHSSDPNTPYLVLRNDPRIWDLWWTAPKAGTGPLQIYVAAVDGNGGSGNAANDQDTINDDTVQTTFFVQESGAPVMPGAGAGCSIADARSASGGGAFVLLLLAAIATLGRRGPWGSSGRCSTERPACRRGR